MYDIKTLAVQFSQNECKQTVFPEATWFFFLYYVSCIQVRLVHGDVIRIVFNKKKPSLSKHMVMYRKFMLVLLHCRLL